MSEEKTVVLDSVLEDKILGNLYRNAEFCSVAAQYLKPSYFSTPVLQNMAKIALDFYGKYRAPCSSVAFVDSLKGLLVGKIIKPDDASFYGEKYKEIARLDLSDHKFVTDKVISFVKKQEMKQLIQEAVTKLLPKEDFDSIEEAMRKISAISSATEAMPYDYFSEEEVDVRTERREKEYEAEVSGREIGISTGIRKMDEIMPKKGFWKKELYNFMAPPKRGKTMALSYFANMAAHQGYNAAYFSCETSIEVLSDRLDAMNASIKIKDLPGRLKEVADAIKSRTPKGRLFLFEFPTKRLTCSEIERKCRKLELEHGVKIGMIISDYAGIMKPERKYNDKLAEEASIYEDLRALASVFDCPVLTASQINRAGSDKAIIKGSDKAGTYEAVMVADANISLSGSEADLKSEKLKIHFAECRNIERRTIAVKTAFSMGRFYDEFIAEEY